MLEYHTTTQGKTMLIAQMDDEHLTNMVLLFLNRALELQEAASESNGNVNEYQRHLYGIETIDAETAAKATRSALFKLYPYLSELFFRDLGVGARVREMLQELMGRSGKLELNTPLLEPRVDLSAHYNPLDDRIDWDEQDEWARQD